MRGRDGFRMRTASTSASRAFGPNMTPMVDIVMVILIFFMAGSVFLGPEWFLNVGMAPSVGAGEARAASRFELPVAREVVRLSVGEGGGVLVQGLGLEGASVEGLIARIEEMRAQGTSGAVRVVIEPSRGSAYQDVIRVYDVCAGGGFAGVGLSKSRPPQPPDSPKPLN